MPQPFYASVVNTTRISPHFVRVALGGPHMSGFARVGFDQWFRLFLPQPGQALPHLPDLGGSAGLREAWLAAPEPIRPVIRNYTVRRHRPHDGEIDVDFVVHGDEGPASAWVQRAEPGDVVGLYDQGAMFAPRVEADWFLLVCDETGLPAVAGVMDGLEGDRRPVAAFVDVPSPADQQELPFGREWSTQWSHPDVGVPDDARLLEAVREAKFRAGTPQAFVVGESSMVRAVRRHLVDERGFAKDQITFCGYWRRDPQAPTAEDDD
ncbi:MAG: siderophore-interacting protein [Stackebrandtia sp.]